MTGLQSAVQARVDWVAAITLKENELDAKKYEELSKNMMRADDEMRQFLIATFPLLSRVGVKLRHGQVNLTPGTVVGHGAHYGYGTVRVRIDTAKERSRRPCRSVSADEVSSL